MYKEADYQKLDDVIDKLLEMKRRRLSQIEIDIYQIETQIKQQNGYFKVFDEMEIMHQEWTSGPYYLGKFSMMISHDQNLQVTKSKAKSMIEKICGFTNAFEVTTDDNGDQILAVDGKHEISGLRQKVEEYVQDQILRLRQKLGK